MKTAPAFTDSFLFPLSYSKTSPVHFINRSINHWDSGPVMIWMINIQAVLQADLLPKCLRKCTRQWFKSLLELIYQINYVFFIFYFLHFLWSMWTVSALVQYLRKPGCAASVRKQSVDKAKWSDTVLHYAPTAHYSSLKAKYWQGTATVTVTAAAAALTGCGWGPGFFFAGAMTAVVAVSLEL